MSPDDLIRRVDDGEIHTVVAAFPDSYGRLIGKRVDARHFVADTLRHGTHACDYLLTVDMEMEPMPGYGFASWAQGYGDVHLVPDLASLRLAAWADGTAWVMCDLTDTETGDPVAVAPRTVLHRQLDAARALGLEARGASELEFFLFADGYREAAQRGYAGLEPAGWYIEDYHLLQGARVEPYVGRVRRALSASGIAVESSKGEWGRGQHEVNIRYGELGDMADRHALMKQAMKEIADDQGVSVTFMAKPHGTEAGSSCHLHVSLWDGGRNAFAGDGAGPADTFRWFLGGWMAHVPDLMVCYAPTVNSYKRYRDGSWAPTRLAWSRDNRTAGFRVVGAGESLRIECRIPGADANPYLAYAAVLASGLHGIANRTEPPEPFDGDVYGASDIPALPRTLADATERFATSTFARQAFGDDVVDHYAHFFRLEVDAFDAAVTDWERARYFERI